MSPDPRRLLLIRLFQLTTTSCGWCAMCIFGQILRAPYPLVGCGFVSGSEAQQCLKSGHWMLAPIMARNKFIEVSLQLIATHAVIGSNKPLLQIANGPIR